MARFRQLKPRVLEALRSDTWEAEIQKLDEIPPAQLVNPLFSFLLHDGEVKWHAVTCMGIAVARMAEENMEQARIVMRRLMWNLSEESGAIGWGCPEAMGEILVNHKRLAREYHRVLCSYVTDTGKDDIFLEHTQLRCGAYWGIARLGQERPDLIKHALPALLQSLERQTTAGQTEHTVEQSNAALRGYVAWALGLIGHEQAVPALETLLQDTAPFECYKDRILSNTTVAELAKEALERIS